MSVRGSKCRFWLILDELPSRSGKCRTPVSGLDLCLCNGYKWDPWCRTGVLSNELDEIHCRASWISLANRRCGVLKWTMLRESETEELKLSWKKWNNGESWRGIWRDLGNFLDNFNSFEPLLGLSRWTDRKAGSHSLTIRPCCCLPPSMAGLGGRRVGDGKARHEVSALISEDGGHISSALVNLF